jgi:hypothetical protein
MPCFSYAAYAAAGSAGNGIAISRDEWKKFVEEIEVLDASFTVAKCDIIFVQASVTPGSTDLGQHTNELGSAQFIEAIIRMAHVKYIVPMNQRSRTSLSKSPTRRLSMSGVKNFGKKGIGTRSNSIKEILSNVALLSEQQLMEAGGAADEEEDPGEAAELLLAESVRRLIKKYVLPNAMKSCYSEFHRQMNMPAVLEIIGQYRTKLKSLFTKYARADDDSQFGNSINLKEFTMFANDKKLLDNGFTRRELVSIFNNAQSETSMDSETSSELSFPEFVDAVGAVSIFKRPNPFIAFETHITQFLKDITPKDRRGSVTMQRELSGMMSASKSGVKRQTRRRNSVVTMATVQNEMKPRTGARRASVGDENRDMADSVANSMAAEFAKLQPITESANGAGAGKEKQEGTEKRRASRSPTRERRRLSQTPLASEKRVIGGGNAQQSSTIPSGSSTQQSPPVAQSKEGST